MMRKLFLALVILLAVQANAQQGITAAEYFIGSVDPGEGNASAMMIIDGAWDEAIEEIFQNNILVNSTDSSFILNIRVKDGANNWGPVFKRAFKWSASSLNTSGSFTMPSVNITEAEYFTGDVDPGNGNASPMLVFDGAFDEAIESVFKDSALLNVDSAFVLNVRVKDVDNQWGPVYRRAFKWTTNSINTSGSFTMPSVNITAAEYFTGDVDPGNGNATPMLVFDGAFDEAIESVFKDSALLNVDSAFVLNVRVKDVSNQWGPVYRKAFKWTTSSTNTSGSFNMASVNITGAEYFTGDIDPGNGKATPMLVFDGAFDEAIESVFKDSALLNVDSSFVLNVRVKDVSNQWGPVYRRAFKWTTNSTNTSGSFTMPSVNITAAEYFTGDIDPGNGNATPMLVFDGAFDEAIESVLKDSALLNVDSAFLFNVRVKDVNNAWGPLYKRAFKWSPSVMNIGGSTTIFQINISSGEYFFGTSDPGEGNATPIIAFDGNYDEAIEALQRTSAAWSISNGTTLFNIRVKDVFNNWGPLFKKVVVINGPSNLPNLIAQGDSLSICEGDMLTLKYTGPNGFTRLWFNGSNADSVSFVPTVSGYYHITAQQGIELYHDSIFIQIKPIANNFFAADSILLCGTTVTLTAASGSYSYLWNNSLTTQSIQATQTGLFICTISNGVCAKNDSVFVSLVNADIAETDTTLCNGAAIQLHAINTIGAVSYLWSNGSTAPEINVTPSATTTYYCTINNGYNSCIDSVMIGVSTPVVYTTASPSVNICNGKPVTLSGSGSVTYSWSNNVVNGVSFIPSTTSTYTITGTDAYGCTQTSSISISVLPLPNVMANVSTTPICGGSSTTLSASGSAISYIWLPVTGLSSTIGTNITASPMATTVYTVTGTDANGCTNTSAQTLTVKQQPQLTSTISNQTYCNGQNVSAIPLIGVPAGVVFDIAGGASRGLPNQAAVTAIPSFTAGPNGSAIISITPKANGCVGPVSTYTMSISNCPPVSVNLKFFIEGYYIGNSMMQPVLYNEGEILDPNSVVTDYVIVELHNATPPYGVNKTTLATLKTNGTVTCNFPGSVTNTLFYIVLHHRNSIETWSANPVMITPNMTYDFSTNISKAFGNNQVQVDPNVFAFYSGDINQDGAIDAFDYIELDPDIFNGNFGYFSTDLNGDGAVDIFDYVIIDPNIFNGIGSVSP